VKGTVKKLILISFLLAIIAAGAVFMYLQSFNGSTEVAGGNKISILVAMDNIPPRTRIDRSMLKQIEVPNDVIFNQYISDGQAIVGKYTRETIFKNEGFISHKLFDESNADLSMRVEEGHRAVSISVTADGGISYLVKPGDFVDVIGFFGDKQGTRPDTAKTVLQNIKILSMDQKLNRDEVKNSQENIPTSFLVTLSVPNADVEKLVLSEGVGRLKLVLRAPEDVINKPTNGVVWSDI
jgi:pilus assembly protein CpaB